MTAISIQIRPIHAASYIMQSGKHIFGRVSIRIIFAYLKNLKKKELNECSFEELEEKGQFQKQFAVDEVENILMWEAIRNHISLGACETEYGDSLSCDYPSRFEIRCEN